MAYTGKEEYLLGIGLSIKNPDITLPEKWQGKNVLGDILTEIRTNLALSNQNTMKLK